MKKYIIFAVICMCLGLCGCTKQEPLVPSAPQEEVFEIDVVNRLVKTDLWIIPDTEANRRTSLWGEAALADFAVDETKTASVHAPAGTTAFLIRMVDTDQMYYAANGVVIEKGQSIAIINGADPMSAFVNVLDRDGKVVSQYEMFAAKL